MLLFLHWSFLSRAQPLRIIVPLYMEPGPTWERLAQSARNHPEVAITAIISPRHYDNDAPMAGDNIYAIARNRTWLDGMAQLRSAGVVLQHYYHMRNLTHSTTQPKHRCCNSWANVSAIVKAALHFFPQDGFFNDNAPMSQPSPDSPLTTLQDIRAFDAGFYRNKIK